LTDNEKGEKPDEVGKLSPEEDALPRGKGPICHRVAKRKPPIILGRGETCRRGNPLLWGRSAGSPQCRKKGSQIVPFKEVGKKEPYDR